MSKLSALMVLALLGGCGATTHPLSAGDGAAGGGSTGSGGGSTGTGGSGGGGATATGGSGPGGGGNGGNGPGGGPGGGFGGSIGGLLDGGLGGLLDSGIIGTCPSAPSGQACGGTGNPLVCVSETSDAGMPSAGCLCAGQRWFCPGMGGGGFGSDGGGQGMTATPCPANAAGMSCPAMGAICMTATGGLCGCLGLQGAAPTWRCTR